jgi:hypothetical protein
VGCRAKRRGRRVIAPARFARQNMAGKPEPNGLSRGLWTTTRDLPETGGVPPCQARTFCDRSGRAADAVRDRSSSLGLARSRPVVAAPGILLLTPARWSASNWQRQLVGSTRVRERFQLEPTWNRWRNHQPVDLAPLFARFQRFHVCASRDVRVCERAHTRAYMREGFAGTVEPTHFLYSLQMDSGSKSVPKWFQFGTAAQLAALGRAARRISNILAGGNVGDLAGDVDQVPAAVCCGGGRAKVLGFSGLGRGLEQLLGLVERNGGNPPFSRGAIGRVGRAMLDDCGQRLGIARFSRLARKPRRLERAALAELAGADRPGTPPCPHSRIRAPLACWHASVSAFGSACRRATSIPEGCAARAGGRQPRGPRTGRGERFASGQGARCAAGRGKGWLAVGQLRRTAEASGRPARVN